MEVKAVFVDAAGTLLRPREPVGITYSRFARQYGYHSDPVRVEARFRDALRRHRGQPVADSPSPDVPDFVRTLVAKIAAPAKFNESLPHRQQVQRRKILRG